MEKAKNWIPPDWLDSEAWQEFEAHRQEIKQPLTDRARKLAMKKLQGLSKDAQRKAINRSIESGWTGLFPKTEEDRPVPKVTKPRRMSEAEWRKRQIIASAKLLEIKKKL